LRVIPANLNRGKDNNRRWLVKSSECGTSHDRDTNAALNILFRSGHRTPVEGIPVL
jgi:transposase